MDDYSEAIETELLESPAILTNTGLRTPRMSDSALHSIGKLAKLSSRLGPSVIFVPANGQPRRESVISEKTMQVVQEMTGVQYEAYGTITGNLEAITVMVAMSSGSGTSFQVRPFVAVTSLTRKPASWGCGVKPLSLVVLFLPTLWALLSQLKSIM